MTGTGTGAAGGTAARSRWQPGFPLRGLFPWVPDRCTSEAGYISGSSRGNPAWRWFFQGIWLVYLVQPVSDLFNRGHTVWWVGGGLAITVAFCALYVLAVGRWDERPGVARWGLAGIFALAVLACVIYGSDWVPLWIYVSVASGFIVPRPRSAMLAVLGVTGTFALFSWLTRTSVGEFLGLLLPVLLVGWAMAGFRAQILLMRELRQARETVAKLAASEERLRLARDMHDLTGQSLSLITLKSDLAARMLGALPGSAQRDAALREVSAIGQVSRQTLHDIREAVSGYRRPTLAVEVITARASLEAAGIHPDENPELTTWSGSFDPDAEAALAWCLREAATNVIRHSGARTCRMTLAVRGGELSLEVSDDGRGFTAPREAGEVRPVLPRTPAVGGVTADGGPAVDAVAADGPRRGSGLHGMAERLSAVGGRFRAEPADRDGRGFRIVATVPRTPARGGQAGHWTHGFSADGAGGQQEPSGDDRNTADDRDAAGVRTATGASVPS
jgi:two-component system sensor histidine kinase DesK